jgi:hypothetical protein
MKSLGNWFQRRPQRAFYLFRLAIYVGFAIYYGTAIDPNALLEIAAGLFGVALTDALGTGAAEKQTVPVVTHDALLEMSAAGQTGAFVAELLRAQVVNFLPGATLAKAVAAVLPSVSGLLSQSLTPERQREVTAKVHSALRQANLIRRVDL